MKIEIEVDEYMIREEVQRQAAKAIADRLCGWALKENLSKVLNKLWDENVDQVVREELADSDKLRAKVEAALERKIQGQLTALMKKERKGEVNENQVPRITRAGRRGRALHPLQLRG